MFIIVYTNRRGGEQMTYDNAVTGRVIREMRKKRGMSQEVLSGLAGIARSHLAMIENGTKNPNVDTLWRIADAFGIPMSQLIIKVEKHISEIDAKKSPDSD